MGSSFFEEYNGNVRFTKQELVLLRSYILYTANNLHGLPSHMWIVLIVKLLDIIGEHTFLNVKKLKKEAN